MKRWEYLTKRSNDPDWALGILGNEGWELVTVVRDYGLEHLTYYFKREKI